MSESNWRQIDFQNFIDDYGIEIVIENAPIILFSKKDKEKEIDFSLLLFLISIISLTVFLSVSFFFFSILYNDILLLSLIILITLLISSIYFFFNYISSKFIIKPLECWVEIFGLKSKIDHQNYCIIYYPIFSGKCHPNNALNILYKLYQNEVYGSTIDISKIELYLRLDKNNRDNNEIIGFFFRYAGGISFKTEDIQDCQWKFFPFEKSSDENYIAVGNWAHNYEWRFDLLLDQNKFEEYSPWIIKKWDKTSLKPLTREIKYIYKWKERFQDLEPHLLPDQINDNKNISLKPKIDHIIENIKRAIRTIFDDEIEIKETKDIMRKLFEFKSFFRDLNS